MKKIIAILFLFTVLFSSCSHYYYLQNSQNVPLFREKNEYRVSAGMGGSDPVSSTDIQAAYSITNHLAVAGSLMWAKGGEPSSNHGSGNLWDESIGYFLPFEEHGVIEIFGGYGESSQHHQYFKEDIDNGMANLSFRTLFLQPALGMTFGGFDFAISTRLSELSFYKIDNQIDPQNREFHFVHTIGQHRTSYLFEPGLTVRGGWKYIKLQLQFLSSSNINNPNLAFCKGKFSVGVVFSFADRFRKKAIPNTEN